MRTLQAAILLLSGPALAAQAGDSFSFSPEPRWRDPPTTEALCEAVRRDCGSRMRGSEIDGEMAFDALYDARGMLVGLRVTRSTGCAPLDEHLLLGERRNRTAFRSSGEADLAGYRIEGPSGARLDGVRIVKAGEQTGIGLDCAGG